MTGYVFFGINPSYGNHTFRDYAPNYIVSNWAMFHVQHIFNPTWDLHNTFIIKNTLV